MHHVVEMLNAFKALNLTLKEVANLAGLTPATILSWKKGKKPSAKSIAKLETALEGLKSEPVSKKESVTPITITEETVMHPTKCEESIRKAYKAECRFARLKKKILAAPFSPELKYQMRSLILCKENDHLNSLVLRKLWAMVNLKQELQSEAVELAELKLKENQKEANDWVEPEEEAKLEVVIFKEPVYSESGKFIGIKFVPVDWQEDMAGDWSDLKRFFDCGVNLWSGSKRVTVPIKSEEAEFSVGSVSLANAVDAEGSLETAARMFNEGITCGTPFDAPRSLQFEMGINPDETYDPILNLWGCEHGLKHAEVVEVLMAKELAAITEFDEVMTMEEERAMVLLNSVGDEVKAEMRRIVESYKTREEAQAKIYSEKQLYTVLGAAMYKARLADYEIEHDNFYRGSDAARIRMSKVHVHDYKEVDLRGLGIILEDVAPVVFELNKIPLLGSFRLDEPIENPEAFSMPIKAKVSAPGVLTNDAEILIEKAKNKNAMITARLAAYTRSLYDEVFGVLPSKAAFYEVEAYLKENITCEANVRLVGMKLKDGTSGLSRDTIRIAIMHARNNATAEFYAGGLYRALMISNVVPKAPKKFNKKAGPKKPAFVASDEIVALIAKIKETGGSSFLLTLSNEQAAKVAEACMGDSEKYRLAPEQWEYVNALRLAA